MSQAPACGRLREGTSGVDRSQAGIRVGANATPLGRLVRPVNQGLRPAKLHENVLIRRQNGTGSGRRDPSHSGEVETVDLSGPERAWLSE